MLNHIIVMGRLTNDPELRMTNSQKPVTSFTVACERDYAAAGERRETDFIDVVAFGNTADFAAKYFTKGSMAVVAGRLQSRDWTDRDNNKRRAWEILADRIYFGEAKAKETKPASVNASSFEELANDGELPF